MVFVWFCFCLCIVSVYCVTLSEIQSVLTLFTHADFSQVIGHNETANKLLLQQVKKLTLLYPDCYLVEALYGIALVKANDFATAMKKIQGVLRRRKDKVMTGYAAFLSFFMVKRLSSNLLQKELRMHYQSVLEVTIDYCRYLFGKHQLEEQDTWDVFALTESVDLLHQVAFNFSKLAVSELILYRTCGDAYNWNGDKSSADQIFAQAVEKRIWKNSLCRPTHMFPFFKDVNPFPDPADFKYILKPFTENLSLFIADFHTLWKMNLADFTLESAGLHETQSWKILPFIIDELRLLHGQVKLSVMLPNTHVKPHCGPTNSRLRMHCSIWLPYLENITDSSGRAKLSENVKIRVGKEFKSWNSNQCFIFDESCEHEVWQLSNYPRVVLIVDFANPYLESEKMYFESLHIENNASKKFHSNFYSNFKAKFQEKQDL